MKPSAAYLVFSQIVSTGLKFGIFLLLANQGGISVAGAYTLGLAVTTPVFTLFKLGLREIYVTNKGRGLAFQRVLLMRGAYGIIAIVFSSVVGILFFPGYSTLIFWMSVFRYTEILADMMVAYFQRENSASRMASVSIAYAVATYGTLGGFYFLFEALVPAMVAAAGAGLIVFVITLLVSRPWQAGVSWLPAKHQISRTFAQGLMLSVSSFAVALGTNTPVLFIESFHSTEQVGYFSAIYHITTLTNILYGSITQLELRGLSVAVHQGAFEKFQARGRLINLVLTVTGVVGAIIIAVAALPIFSWVMGQDFTPVYPAILAMGVVICLTPSGFLLDTQMVALQRFSAQSAISISSLFIVVLLSFVLIPHFAVLGGVGVVIASLVFRNSIKYFLVRKQIRALEMAKALETAR